jgi:glycosyltransferase involved in cell wall biosynthesis
MKISVITVVLNNKSYLEDCINSVVRQNYNNVEYIVIDGGSTDGTIDIIRKNEEYITTWISESDLGMYDAMNKGITLASGEVMGILNSDDVYYDAHVLEDVASVMRDSKIDACYSDLVYVDTRNLNKVVRYWRSRRFETGLFKKGWVPAHPTLFIRKQVYDQYGVFDLKYKLAADFELMVRFLEYYRIRVAYIPKIFVKMRTGGATNKSISNIVKQNFEIFQACKKNDMKISSLSFLMNKFITRLHQFYFKPAL